METIGRYECSTVGTMSQEPIGDRAGHGLVSVQYSGVAVEGLLKEAVLTGSSISEWNGRKGTYLFGGGIHRAPGGIAVSQITEGTGSLVMKDGKAVGTDASGTVVFKFAAGTLTALSGKLPNSSASRQVRAVSVWSLQTEMRSRAVAVGPPLVLVV